MRCCVPASALRAAARGAPAPAACGARHGGVGELRGEDNGGGGEVTGASTWENIWMILGNHG